MRRGRIGAAVAAVVAVAALVIGVTAQWRSSDAATTRIVVAASPPPAQYGPLPDTVRRLWSAPAGPGTSGSGGAGSHSVPGSAVEGTTVVVAGVDQLAGLDPRTGAQRWSYRRGNARLCGWAAQDGVVIGAFGGSSGCSDMTALDAGTGRRRWYRNADLGTDPVLVGASGVVVIGDGDQLLAVDTDTGLNRWTDQRAGCHLSAPAASQQDVVVLARCGGGRTLLVDHDPYASSELWTVPLPPGADGQLLTASAPGDEVAVLMSGSATGLWLYGRAGKVTSEVGDRRLEAAGSSSGPAPTALTVFTELLVWTGHSVVAVGQQPARVLWSAPALTPAVSDNGQILLAEPAGATGSAMLVERAPLSGQPARRIAVNGSATLAGARLARVGPLLVASEPSSVVCLG